MCVFKFDDFIFDPNSFNLSYQGSKVPVRPKAIKLLSLLIQNKHRILSKDEIMFSVWGNVHARDYQLFQLIGELRKPPFKNKFIRTQPNEGYQWNVTTKTINKFVFVPQLIAASVVIGLVTSSLITFPILNDADSGPTHTVQLPAFNALSKGIVALENGNKDKAVEWFEFALLENPGAVEPSLFLAETLYQQNKPEESSKYLQDVLNKENLSVYNKAAAANILSRISEQQGKFGDALLFAQKSAQTKVVGQCSIDFVEQRIIKLESEIEMSPVLAVQDKVNNKESMPVPDTYARQCNELKNEPVETSSCIPFNNEGIEYAMSKRSPKFITT
jgi:DNA-binding winged helix-turn-helix (wHTH) protein